jgi:hypothetical protein
VQTLSLLHSFQTYSGPIRLPNLKMQSAYFSETPRGLVEVLTTLLWEAAGV